MTLPGARVMEIRLARHGRHVAVVTVDNQPRLNAMTRQMLNKLGRLWDELERDGDCRCNPSNHTISRTPSAAALPSVNGECGEWPAIVDDLAFDRRAGFDERPCGMPILT